MDSLPSMFKKIGDNHFLENSALCYEDFIVGSKIDSDHGRTITESDCMWLTMLLGIETPVHINRDYASKTEFKDVIVEQAVVFGITVGLHSRLISGAAAVNLEFDEIKALLPVKIGDTLYVSSEVISKRDLKSRPTQGLVVIKMTTKNQKGEIVLTSKRTMFIWKKADRPATV